MDYAMLVKEYGNDPNEPRRHGLHHRPRHPGIFLRLDDMATAPAWVYIGSLGWLGTYVAYPAWALWLGAIETRRAGRSPSQSDVAEGGFGIERAQPTRDVS